MSQHNPDVQQSHAEPDSGMIAVIGIVASLLLFFAVMGMMFYFHYFQSREFARKVEEAPMTLIREIRAEEDERLNQYAWLSDAREQVRIPIDRAMELEATQGSWHARRPEPTPTPAITPLPTAAEPATPTAN